ncbi:MAG: phosphoribosylanthranilate isomerase [Dehalococcoidia bacterium]|nr:phosphoribosylanthranilate isomerase [Dehalococcoidia bacterium]
MLVKICGLREPAHALAAAESGADLLGMIFVPSTRRYITPDQARAIVQAVRKARGANAPKLIGVFQNQPIAQVNELAQGVGLDYVQLAGNESNDFCKQSALPPLKVLHVRADRPREQTIAELDTRLSELNTAGWLAMLDKYLDAQGGGTGQTFDWTIAAELAGRGHRFLLAGGLTSENVSQAVRAAHPFGVDVSSGVETSGAKDIAKIQAFIKVARTA